MLTSIYWLGLDEYLEFQFNKLSNGKGLHAALLLKFRSYMGKVNTQSLHGMGDGKFTNSPLLLKLPLL